MVPRSRSSHFRFGPAEIFYFKPQVIYVSLVFLTVIAYAFGEFMAAVIPRRG